MTIISEPQVNITKIPATPTPSLEDQKVLFVGQKVAAGTAPAGVLVTEIANDNSEDTLFGARSMLAGMIRAFKKKNKITRVDAIPLDDSGTGVAATGTLAFSGTATAAGIITVNIASRINHTYKISVAVDDTATIIGDAIDTATAADTDAPFTTSNSTGTVTVTAANDGVEGNFIGLEVKNLPAGITCTVTGMASGANNPVLTNVFDVINGIRYQTIVIPATYGYSELKTLLANRWNTDNNVLDGVGIVTKTDSVANLKSNEGSQNSRDLVAFGNKTVSDTYYKGSAIFELDYIQSAYFAAVRALRLTEGANISQYIVTTAGLLDVRGGAALASLPYANTPFSLLPIIDEGKGFTQTEVNELAAVGVSVMGNNIARTSIICGRVYTTYLTDSASNPDETWHFLPSRDTASAVGEYYFRAVKIDYNQSRLTEGDLLPGRSMVNREKVRAAMVRYYATLSGADYVLVEAGDDAIDYFKENMVVNIVKATGTINITTKTPIVVGARTFNITIQTVFTIN